MDTSPPDWRIDGVFPVRKYVASENSCIVTRLHSGGIYAIQETV